MNLIVATIIVVVAMCDAEPPRFRDFRHFQRQVVQTNPDPAPEAAAAPAPYPASGYRPSGAQFNLPQKEYGAPSQGYGPPEDQQPQGTTTEFPETTTTFDEDATTLEPQAENIKVLKDKQRPVFLVVPRAQAQAQAQAQVKQQLRSQSYVTYVQEYPEVELEVDAEPEQVVFQRNAAIYSGKLQALPLNVYNPYAYSAYYQIYQ